MVEHLLHEHAASEQVPQPGASLLASATATPVEDVPASPSAQAPAPAAEPQQVPPAEPMGGFVQPVPSVDEGIEPSPAEELSLADGAPVADFGAALPEAPPAPPVQAEPVVTSPVPSDAPTAFADAPAVEEPVVQQHAADVVSPAAPQPPEDLAQAPPAAAPEAVTPAAPQAPTGATLPEDFGRPDRPQALQYSAPNAEGGVTTTSGTTSGGAKDPLTGQVTSAGPSRNAPCPCGSGRKYKRCHGDPTKG